MLIVAIAAATVTAVLIIMAADITELIMADSIAVIIMVIMVIMVPDSVLALVGDTLILDYILVYCR